MKTNSRTLPTECSIISSELKALRHELAEIKAILGRTTSHYSSHESRYLSEADAAAYQLASSHISDQDDVIRFCRVHFRLLIERGLQEELHVLTLNGAHHVIRSHQVTVGVLNSTQVHPREVFRPAITDAAASIILVHNHPSGNPQPSKEDIKATEEIEAAGKLVGIRLLDHVIVSRSGCRSINEHRNRRSLIG